MRKEIEKYKALIKQEEERIRKESVRKFRFLKNDSRSMKNLVIGKEGRSKYDKNSVEYLKGRYNRLKRIGTDEIDKHITLYAFDDYVRGLEEIMRRLGVRRKKSFRETIHTLNSLTDKQKRIFIENGYAISLSEEYIRVMNEIVENQNVDSWYSTYINWRVEQIKSVKK